MTAELQIIWMTFDKTRFNGRDPMTHTINIHINYVLDSCFALVMTGPISAQHAIPIGSFFTYNTSQQVRYISLS